MVPQSILERGKTEARERDFFGLVTVKMSSSATSNAVEAFVWLLAAFVLIWRRRAPGYCLEQVSIFDLIAFVASVAYSLPFPYPPH